MSDKLQELALWLGLTATGVASQFGVSVEEAQKIADNIIGSMSDYYEVKEKIDEVKRQGERQITLNGYTITF